VRRVAGGCRTTGVGVVKRAATPLLSDVSPSLVPVLPFRFRVSMLLVGGGVLNVVVADSGALEEPRLQAIQGELHLLRNQVEKYLGPCVMSD
jgi:hypothetical protein